MWSEATFVAAGGLVLGAVSGWWLAQVIVKILTGVFDPPPETLLAAMGLTSRALACIALAVVAAGAGIMRAPGVP